VEVAPLTANTATVTAAVASCPYAHWLYHWYARARTSLELPLSPLQIAILVCKVLGRIDIERGFNDEEDIACDYAKYFNAAFSYSSGNARVRDDEFIVEMCDKAKELGNDAFLTEEELRKLAP